MATQALSVKGASAFPIAEVRRRLRIELQKIAADAAVLRPPWEPMLDSKRVVGTVLVIEDLFPSYKIPPDQVVRKGGYDNVDEAMNDMINRILRVLAEANKTKVGK